MASTIGYLGPEGQTYGWLVAREVVRSLGIDATLVPEKDQTPMLDAVLRGVSEHVACVVAYSNNLGIYGVTGVFDTMIHHMRKIGNNCMIPERLIAIARTSIEQCLIGQPGASIKEIKVIHAHPQAANQVTKWKQKFAQDATVMSADSNGAAINLAILAGDPTVAAIGPAFGIRDGIEVLEKGIDNHPGSVTNFALVHNRKRDPLQIATAGSQHGTILLTKSGPDIGASMMALSGLVASHELQILGARARNSPYSGRLVQVAEVHAESRDQLRDLITDMQEGMSDMFVTVSRGEKQKYIPLSGAFDETNHLGPCPVIEVASTQ